MNNSNGWLNMNKCISFIFLVSLIAACSNKDLYQAGQEYQKSECINQAQTSEQHNECLNMKKQSYEEYEKERKATVKK
ncbi:hypothetical protein L3081_23250 [Colwellia sp. MSW7]|uniref:Lipoprotein n=1 Tax=Colwellia maritima TaxID=2912588 RepID=A0ABS9X693_9GAMM|nr:hypothetical protein [Colwellia maritima]MCI2285760.1 hypothetical protein [Colwellia maritima]